MTDKMETSEKQLHENSQPVNQMPQTMPLAYYRPAEPAEPDDIDLLELWKLLWRNKRLIFLITVLFTTMSVALALWMTPIYQSEVLLAPVTDEDGGKISSLASQYGGLAAMAGINLGGSSSSKEEAVALLKSRALIMKFIEEENLLPELFYKDWDSENMRWDVKSPDEIPTMWKAYKKFDQDVRSVTEDKKTGLVTLSIEWKDPNLAKKWAISLVERVNEQMRNRATEDAEKSLVYLNQELKRTSSVEVQKAIYGLIESQVKTAMMANIREEYSFKVIDPPAVPDLDDEVKPNKKLIVALALTFGFFGSLFYVIIRDYYEKKIALK